MVRRPLSRYSGVIVTSFAFLILSASFPTFAESLDANNHFDYYSVRVIKTAPFRDPFAGYGVYLGGNAVITAAHNIGRWHYFKTVRVVIAGKELPAAIDKIGSSNRIDLALLSIDSDALPISFRLRRNPLCTASLTVGQEVVVAVPGDVRRTHIISPLLVPPDLRRRFRSLTAYVAGPSGSGVFDAERHCLMGIMSKKIRRFESARADRAPFRMISGFAGYFVPAAEIREFIRSSIIR